MSTESRIEARDAKAAGGVVAEGREHDAPMTDVQVKHMVERFLRWRLPDDFHPDNGISFKPTFNEHLERPTRHEPNGTNLFSATQADAMVRHMIEGLPPYPSPDTNADGAAEREVGRFIYRRIEKLMGAKAGTSEGDELDYLAQIVSDVEEYGATGDEVIVSFPAAQAREAGLREEDIKAAYIAGFMASGEGWNGEYPFHNDPLKAWPNIERYFNEYRAAPTPEAPDHD